MSEQRYREFRMPDVGEGLTEAEILKWFVQPGDTVHDGMVVCEVETAKAAVELPIPFDGVVHEILFGEGETVDVGRVIITVDTQPGAPGAAPAPEATPEPQAQPQAEPEPAPGPEKKRQAVLVGYGVAESSTRRRPRRQAPTLGEQAPALQAPTLGEQAPGLGELNGGHGRQSAAVAPPSAQRPLAKPPVRKLAKDLGVDLTTVTPSGPHGDITRDDVQAAAAPPAAPQTAPAAEPTPVPAAERQRRVRIKGVRKATAQAMVASAFTAPHVTEFVTVDVTRTMRLAQQLKQDPAFAGLKVSPLLLVAKALLVAIRRNPDVNAAWDEANQEIVHFDYVNLGIAAATPRGLIVPNIKDAHARTLPELTAALGELITTAREGRTSPADMQGGTVTITNVGVFGVDTGTPILNPGESAILAFGAVRERPWVHKGKIKPRQVTTLALSFDHRLIDGELGSRFLGDIAAILEHPKRLMTWA